MQLFFILGVILGFSESANSPKPIEPGVPYKYPDNYCENYDPNLQFDFIVIGSGPGGSTVARRLAEIEKFNVLLLEAGDNPPAVSDIPSLVSDIPKSYKWPFITAQVDGSGCRGFKGNTCEVGFGKVLGGSSVVNLLIYVRGNKEDFNEIAALGNPGWSYEDMLPYYKKMENFQADREPQIDHKLHGFGGPISNSHFPLDPHSTALTESISAAFDNQSFVFNVDYNGESQTGYTWYTGTIDKLGYRCSASKGYLTNNPKNLKICKNALATKILFEGKNASGVEFIYTNKNKSYRMKAIATKEYILSGGPFNTPALLERSGIGQEEILRKLKVKPVTILNGVGENMNNHYYNLAQAFVLGKYPTVAITNPLSNGVFGFGGFFNFTDFSSDVTDTQIYFRFYEREDLYFGNLKNNIRKQMNDAGTLLVATATTIRGNPIGSTHITQTKDPTITPNIVEMPYGDKASRDRVVRNTRIMRKIMLSESLEKYDIKPFVLKDCQKYPYNSYEEILCGAEKLTQPFHHESGTASMGPSSDKYVVDARLKVYGVNRLRVVDVSVFPLVPRGNTVVPTYTLAEKAADLIKEDYGVLDE